MKRRAPQGRRRGRPESTRQAALINARQSGFGAAPKPRAEGQPCYATAGWASMLKPPGNRSSTLDRAAPRSTGASRTVAPPVSERRIPTAGAPVRVLRKLPEQSLRDEHQARGSTELRSAGRGPQPAGAVLAGLLVHSRRRHQTPQPRNPVFRTNSPPTPITRQGQQGAVQRTHLLPKEPSGSSALPAVAVSASTEARREGAAGGRPLVAGLAAVDSGAGHTGW